MRSFIAGAVLLFSFHASAVHDVYDYSYWGHKQMRDYVSLIDKTLNENPQLTTPETFNKCVPLYSSVLEKGEMDIRYALGYFDITKGGDIFWEKRNYGKSPSADPAMYRALRQLLTEPCKKKNQLQLCGFKEKVAKQGGLVHLQKNIMLFGKPIQVKMTLTVASASDSYEDNLGSLASKQSLFTQQSEDNFFNGVGVADVVIYNGHSRKGGGPDFRPPVLDSENHPDYEGYYRIKKPGISQLLEKLENAPNKKSILGLFSCESKSHFYKDLTALNAKQPLVLTEDLVDYLDTLVASMGYLQGVLHGACGQELADIAKQGEFIKTNFQGFQIR